MKNFCQVCDLINAGEVGGVCSDHGMEGMAPMLDLMAHPHAVPPHTMRTLANEVELAGHFFAAKVMRDLAEGRAEVRELGAAHEMCEAMKEGTYVA